MNQWIQLLLVQFAWVHVGFGDALLIQLQDLWIIQPEAGHLLLLGD